MKTNLLPQETLEDLQCGNLFLIQKESGFRFGTDAVLLAGYAKSIKSKRTLDLCTGSGIVPILLSHKTNTPELHAIEIQEDIADMAKRSVVYNGLEERINIICGDLKDAALYYQPSSFDLITCNPPYMKSGSAILNQSDTKIISRHEVLCTLEDVIKASARLLKYNGHLVMIHRPNRLTDVLSEMRNNFIEPKVLRFIHTHAKNPPTLFIADGMLQAKRDIKILPPLIMYDDNGNESAELRAIYERI